MQVDDFMGIVKEIWVHYFLTRLHGLQKLNYYNHFCKATCKYLNWT
jgi:hypothetical protein